MGTPEGTSTTPATGDEGLSWRKLASWGAFAIPIIFILLMLAYMTFIPFFIPNIVVFGVLGWWVGRGGRASVIVLAILAVVFIAINVPFIVPTLGVPASVIDFTSTAWLLLAAITALVASLIASRTDAPSSGPRTFQRVIAGLAVLAVVVSIVSTATYDDAEEREGDVTVVTEDIEFQPEDLTADSGTVAVYVTNNDPTFHTFTIDELDISLDIPADSTARIEFEAESGEYEFYCVPHEADMKGTLQVQ